MASLPGRRRRPRGWPRCSSGSCRISRAAALSSTTSTRSVRELLGNDLARARGRADAEPDGEEERAADAGLAFEPDAAAHQLDQPAADGQAQAGAAVLARRGHVGLRERLETASPTARGVMPMPVSRTENLSCTFSPVRSSSSMLSRISPCSVNLTALLTKLVRIWPRRSGSPSRCSGIAGATCGQELEALVVRLLGGERGDGADHLVEPGSRWSRCRACPPRSSRNRGCR